MIPYAYVTIHLAGTDVLPPATENIRYDKFVQNLFKAMNDQEMKSHCAFGIGSEAGELIGVIKDDLVFNKTHTKEGKTIREALIEELGDLSFYQQAVMQMYSITPDEVFQGNADKLSKRYVGLKYSDRAAADRADKEFGF